MIRKDMALCITALSYAIRCGQMLDSPVRSLDLLTRLRQHVDYMCQKCEGVGSLTPNIKDTECAYCSGSGINVDDYPDYRERPRFFCAPEQVGPGVQVGDNQLVVTGAEVVTGSSEDIEDTEDMGV